MPAKWFLCPDNEKIEISECLKPKGCRLTERCSTLAFLRLIGYDREWRGVSPSSSGNGPRLLYLTATTDYTVDPDKRVWSAFGTSTHDRLAAHKLNINILSEEPLSDDEMQGIADVLEEDEYNPGSYILTDYKTWGSFKVAKALGISIKKKEEPVIENGQPVLLKSGPNKGKPKTTVTSIIVTDPTKADLTSEELQLNRYRIFYESKGFPVSKMRIQVVSRDGGTYVAKNRGIFRNLCIIPIKRYDNEYVLTYYRTLQSFVDEAFETGYIRLCSPWENWEGRRCDGFCDVSEACREMSKQHNEKWIKE